MAKLMDTLLQLFTTCKNWASNIFKKLWNFYGTRVVYRPELHFVVHVSMKPHVGKIKKENKEKEKHEKC